MDLSKGIVDELKTIADRHNVDKIILFGSRARGDNSQTSDIDLAIYIEIVNENDAKIYFDIDEIHTLLKFDIVFIDNNTDIELINNIKKDGVIIYEHI